MPTQNWEHNDDAEVWGYNYGDEVPTVTVWERQDKDGIVYVRWYVDGTQQGPYSLGYRIRKNGEIDKDLRQKAEDAAQAYYEALSLWTEGQRENRSMHIDGRNAHGLRRRVARMSRQKGIDREARNAAWGWKRGSTVPDRLYDETDEELRQAGADAREEVLGTLGRDEQREHGSETTGSDEPGDKLLAALVDEYGSFEAAIEALRERKEDPSRAPRNV